MRCACPAPYCCRQRLARRRRRCCTEGAAVAVCCCCCRSGAGVVGQSTEAPRRYAVLRCCSDAPAATRRDAWGGAVQLSVSFFLFLFFFRFSLLFDSLFLFLRDSVAIGRHVVLFFFLRPLPPACSLAPAAADVTSATRHAAHTQRIAPLRVAPLADPRWPPSDSRGNSERRTVTRRPLTNANQSERRRPTTGKQLGHHDSWETTTEGR